jgi:type I restriction enzyme S subunit
LDEQRKIANFLDIKTAQFDSIIAKKEQLITKLEEAKKSLISEVVTGKVKIVDGQLVPRPPEEMKDSGVEWLGMIPNEWSLPKLKYHSVRITQGPNPNYEKNIPTSERFKVLKTKDLYDKEILYSQADNILK